jgi:hypothetical protein
VSGDQDIPVKPAVKDVRPPGNLVEGGKAKNSPLTDREDGSGVVGTPLVQAGTHSGPDEGWLFDGRRRGGGRRHLGEPFVAEEKQNAKERKKEAAFPTVHRRLDPNQSQLCFEVKKVDPVPFLFTMTKPDAHFNSLFLYAGVMILLTIIQIVL